MRPGLHSPKRSHEARKRHRSYCLRSHPFLYFILGLTGCGGDSGPTPGSLSITTTSLPEGEVNQAYSASLSGAGGALPYTWSVTPALPANLSLDTATGAITGTPTTQATTTHTFTLRDSSAPSQTVQQTLNLTVRPAPAGWQSPPLRSLTGLSIKPITAPCKRAAERHR